MFHETRLLVLDEPTAVLTPQEVDQLLATLRRMADAGRGLVFISHKLHEVMAFADRITVMRDGVVTGEVRPESTTRQELADLMVGRPVKLAPDRTARPPGDVVLAVRGLSVVGDRDQTAVDDVSLDVCAGEVLGIAGVSGNGQRELAEAIAGLRHRTAGTIRSAASRSTARHPAMFATAGSPTSPRSGCATAPSGRSRCGRTSCCSTTDGRRSPARPVAPGGDPPARRQLVREFAVRTPGLDTPTRTLSGGNIQKLIMAREVSSAQRVLVASQPTRGVDIGAAEYIHARLMAARDAGLAVLVISEDLDEVLALSDRVAVMFAGRIVGTLDRPDCTTRRLGMMMAGAGDPGPPDPSVSGIRVSSGHSAGSTRMAETLGWVSGG